MCSTLFRRLSPAPLSLLLLSACSPHPSTPASIARTERPTLPTLPPALVKPERLEPLASPTSGELVSIDRATLGELYQRLAQAATAIERGNVRAGGVMQLWGCVDVIFRTGTTPAGCTPPTPHP